MIYLRLVYKSYQTSEITRGPDQSPIPSQPIRDTLKENKKWWEMVVVVVVVRVEYRILTLY